MQTPQVAGPLSRGKLGYLIVLLSSALVAISFFAFPYIVYSNSSSYGDTNRGQTSTTLFQAVQQSAPMERFTTLYTINNAIIWTVCIFAVAAFIISLLLLFLPTSRGVAASSGISFIVMGSMQVAHIGVGILTLSASVTGTSPIGIGGWFCLLGMLAVLIGGIIVVMARSLGTAANGYSYGAVYPPQQQPVGYGQYPLNASFPNSVPYPPQPSSPNDLLPPQ